VTREEIIQTLKRNIDKPVRLVYASGDVKRVVPIGVDTLGFVYDEDRDGLNSFFAPFDNIKAVAAKSELRELIFGSHPNGEQHKRA